MSRGRSAAEPSTRLLRVSENVRHAIASVLSRGSVQDPDLNGVSVTVSEARVSPDLRNATIFVMALGGDTDHKVVKALNRNSAFIRGEMSRLVTMKYMPRLKFLEDESFDEASKIDHLLRDPKVQKDLRSGSGGDSEDDTDREEGV